MSDTTRSYPAVKSLSFLANFVGILAGLYGLISLIWGVINVVSGGNLQVGEVTYGGFPVGVGTPLYWVVNLGFDALLTALSVALVWAGFRARREVSA